MIHLFVYNTASSILSNAKSDWDRLDYVKTQSQSHQQGGSGCNSDGRAIVFETSGLRFKSSHRLKLYNEYINCRLL